MKNMIQEFKDFALKGNVVELAIAFVLGAAFATVVTGLVELVVMPIVAAIFGEPSFDRISIGVGDSEILIGAFITVVINFLLVALALFLFVVKPYKALQERKAAEEEAAPAGPSEIELLTAIRDSLAK